MTEDSLRCSFCNKSQNEVRRLIAGPHVQICDECVEMCVAIAVEDSKEQQPDDAAATGMTAACSLCHMHAPAGHMIIVPNRGALCPSCIVAIEGAVAASRQSQP